MPVLFEEGISYQGEEGMSVMIFTLFPYSEITHQKSSNKKPMSFAQQINGCANEKESIKFRNRFSGRELNVPIRDILLEHDNIDIEKSSLRIETYFLIGKGNSLLKQMRSRGIPEKYIQIWIGKGTNKESS